MTNPDAEAASAAELALMAADRLAEAVAVLDDGSELHSSSVYPVYLTGWTLGQIRDALAEYRRLRGQ